MKKALESRTPENNETPPPEAPPPERERENKDTPNKNIDIDTNMKPIQKISIKELRDNKFSELEESKN
jgi:hypothetical protein